MYLGSDVGRQSREFIFSCLAVLHRYCRRCVLFSVAHLVELASPTASSPGKQNVEVALEPEPVEQLNFDEDVETPEADVSYRSEEESEELEFCPYYFIQSLPAYEEVAIPNREHVLPKPTETPPKMSLVLDLDETLVHCSVEAVKDADYKFPVEYDGMEYMIHARKRPHMDHFLQSVAEKFEVIVFTASQVRTWIDRGTLLTTNRKHMRKNCWISWIPSTN